MDYIGIITARKIIDGKLYRRYFIDSQNKEVGIPVGVQCVKMGAYNYVAARDLNCDVAKTGISYTDKQTQEAALKKMISVLSVPELNVIKTSPSERVKKKALRVTECSGIDNSTLPVGITLLAKKKKHCTEYVIAVSYYNTIKKRFSCKIFYCGGINTWRNRYEQMLQKAIKLRQDSLVEYHSLTQTNPD